MDKISPAACRRGFRAVLFVVVVLMLGGTLPTPLYVIYQQELHFSEIVLTLAFGLYFVGALAGLLFCGRLSDQIGRRPTVVLGIGLAVASTLALILLRGLPLLFVGRAVSGTGNGIALAATTAWLSELRKGAQVGENPRGEAAETSAVDQMIGLGLGPLLAGMLAEYAALPTLLSYYVLLGLLAAAALALIMAPETVPQRRSLSFIPRIGVPHGKRAAFISLAATGFCIFALTGLFTSLVPSVLQQRLHNTSHAVAGAVAFELFLLGALTELALRRMPVQPALLVSLALIPLGLVLLMLGVVQPSVWWLIGGTAVEGVAAGLGFSNTLAAVNQLAGGAERAHVLASFFVVMYFGAMLPVIGMGIISQLANGLAAAWTFSCIIGLLALAGLAARLLGFTRAETAAA